MIKNNRIFKSAVLSMSLLVLGCSPSEKETETATRQKTERPTKWQFIKKLDLGDIAPIGIAALEQKLWLSDVDNNRVVEIDLEGKIIESFSGFERPMHIAIQGHQIYIPEYTLDSIRILENGILSTFSLNEQTDAIGGVAIKGNTVAVADFYNNRIILQQDDEVTLIGKEGHNNGELYYPTDLEIHNNLIYVADAYNNRVQVFDFDGKYMRVIGWKEGINVATGVKVTGDAVFIADFEGNRVLIYDHFGKLMQILSENFNKPTDIEIIDNIMYVVNYSGHNISVFELK